MEAFGGGDGERDMVNYVKRVVIVEKKEDVVVPWFEGDVDRALWRCASGVERKTK